MDLADLSVLSLQGAGQSNLLLPLTVTSPVRCSDLRTTPVEHVSGITHGMKYGYTCFLGESHRRSLTVGAGNFRLVRMACRDLCLVLMRAVTLCPPATLALSLWDRPAASHCKAFPCVALSAGDGALCSLPGVPLSSSPQVAAECFAL